jgi:hypothetical protein
MALTRIGPNQSVNLASNVTGTLPVGNGGIGIASGTTDQFLKFTGTTTLASAADNAGGLVLLSSGSTTSTTSSIAITGTQVTSTYDHYRLFLNGKAEADNKYIYMRYRNSSNDGLISSNYSFEVKRMGATNIQYSTTASTYIDLTQLAAAGTGANEGFNLILDFMSPLSNTVPTVAMYNFGAANTSDSWIYQIGAARRNDGTETHTGFTLYWNTGGDFDSYTYQFYGLAKS